MKYIGKFLNTTPIQCGACSQCRTQTSIRTPSQINPNPTLSSNHFLVYISVLVCLLVCTIYSMFQSWCMFQNFTICKCYVNVCLSSAHTKADCINKLWTLQTKLLDLLVSPKNNTNNIGSHYRLDAELSCSDFQFPTLLRSFLP